MKNDPIVAEIRAIRDAYAKRFDYDLQAIYEDLKKKEEAGTQRIVVLPPRKPQKVATESQI